MRTQFGEYGVEFDDRGRITVFGPERIGPLSVELLTAVIRAACDEQRRPQGTSTLEPMTLDEAIYHAETNGEGDDPCAAEHRQLADWLRELRDLKTPKPKLQEWVTKLPGDEQAVLLKALRRQTNLELYTIYRNALLDDVVRLKPTGINPIEAFIDATDNLSYPVVMELVRAAGILCCRHPVEGIRDFWRTVVDGWERRHGKQ